MNEDAAARARAWVHAAQAAVCDVIEPWDHGTIVRATPYPTYFDFNLVRVEDAVELSAEEVVAIADEALDGLSHRQVGFEVAECGEGARHGLEALGWRSSLLVWMLHSGESQPRAKLEVERVAYDHVHDLRVAWHYEDFPTLLDTLDHFDHVREIAMSHGVQVFAVRDGSGAPVAFAELEVHGAGAEIASVYVHPDHRGAGMGTALTQAAIEAAPGDGDLWIVTDADGGARQIYERLGFRAAWSLLNFMRLPPG
jgi:GNAT superfamily N-acetyltransferase